MTNLTLVTLSISHDHLFELHASSCADLKKKTRFDAGFEVASIAEARQVIEGENDVFIEETGNPNAGYHMADHCKIFGCVNK